MCERESHPHTPTPNEQDSTARNAARRDVGTQDIVDTTMHHHQGHSFREDKEERRHLHKRFLADLASFQINQDVLRYGSTTLMNLSWDLMIDWLAQLARSMGRFQL